jgi:hypothetical protein
MEAVANGDVGKGSAARTGWTVSIPAFQAAVGSTVIHVIRTKRNGVAFRHAIVDS